MRYKSLDSTIRDILSSIDDQDAKGYLKMYRIMINQLKMLDLHVQLSDPRHIVTVGSNLTYDMPDDCITVPRVSYLGKDKVLYPIGKLDNLYGDETNKLCDDPLTVSEDEDESVFTDLNFDMLGYGEIFYAREKYWVEGMYRYNKDLNRLEFVQGSQAYSGAKLVAHYKSANTNKAEIPVELYNVVRSACLWHWYQGSNPGLSDRHRQELKMHVRNYNDLQAPITPEDIIATIREQYTHVPR